MHWNTAQTRTAIIFGIGGGVLAGIAMALWMMIKAGTANQGFWSPLSVCMAAFAYPHWANQMMDNMMMMEQHGQMMHASFEGVHGLVGIVLHLAVSAGFGVVFAVALSRGLGERLNLSGSIAAGIVYGFAIWLVMQFAVLPVLNGMMADNIKNLVGIWVFLLAHLIFGIVLGAIVGWQYRTRQYQARPARVA